MSQQNGASTSNGQMFDIQVNAVPTTVHVYERFKLRLFEGLDYRKRDAAVSLHKLFRFIEKTVRVLGKNSFQFHIKTYFRRRKCSLSMLGCVQRA
jgi:hypothetical protein